MPENSHKTQHQFSLRLLLVMIAGVVLLVYFSSQIWNSRQTQLNAPPMRLAKVLTYGGLQRSTTIVENGSDKPFEGGILVLKNDGVIYSKPISITAKGTIGIESNRGVTTLLHSQRDVLLDLQSDFKQTTLWNWIPKTDSYIFEEMHDEWVYEELSFILNDILHTYKIIICQDYKQAMSKYSQYDPKTHPGQAAIKPVEVPQRTIE